MIEDPRFPHLREVMQPARMQALLEKHLYAEANGSTAPSRVESCVIGEKRYAPGKRFILTYRLNLRAEQTPCIDQQIVGLSLIPAERDEPSAIAADCGGPDAGGRVYLPEIDAVAWLFPHDRLLTQLPQLLDADFIAGYLPGVLRELGYGCEDCAVAVAAEVLHYLPECSCMIRFRASFADTPPKLARTLTLYAKVYGDESGAGIFAAMQQLAAQLPNSARPIRFDRELNTLWQSHVDGAALDWRMLEGPDGTEVVDRMASAVADLHRCQLTAEERFGRDEIDRQLRATVKAAKTFAPQWAARVEQLAGRLLDIRTAAQWPEAPHTPVHRDLKLGNILIDESVARLIDLDCVCLGDPLSDMGGLAASIFLNGFRENGDPAHIENCADQLWRVYATAVPWHISPAQADWYTAAALLYEVVRRSFRQFDEWRMAHVETFIALSERYCASLQGI